ncbi:MAG: non-heme iron oxygenase ferredoxin subunit [Chloroflexi bacterium]|nr:non-heme iron oxygenase ferredoxin subunit [Chloroflexota bacterium]
MEGFVPVAKIGDLEPGDMKLVEAGDERIVLANLGGEYFAFSDTCTHMECSLSDGSIDGEIVECPCHGSQFSVKTGAVENGPAVEAIAVYPVRIQGRDILVGARPLA